MKKWTRVEWKWSAGCLFVLLCTGSYAGCGSSAKNTEVNSPEPAGPDLCQPVGGNEANCADGLDDDCDGSPDCQDADCAGAKCGENGLTCGENVCSLAGVFEPLPPLSQLRIALRGDTVVYSFLPNGEAKDYRIWALPDPSQIKVNDDGSQTVTDAVYRCAGNRPLSLAAGTSLGAAIPGYQRTEAESLLGYAYAEGAADRVPVFALGDPSPDSDDRTGSPFQSTRVVVYTTSLKERTSLLKKGFRDDGVPFYVPKEGDGAKIYTHRSAPQAADQNKVYQVVVADGKEWEAVSATEGSETKDLFRLAKKEGTGLFPLYRVTVANHDVLALGEGLRDRYLTQGNQPLSALSWSGLKEGTTLVLEALDRGCTFEGHYAATDTVEEGYAKPFLSISRVQGESATGEITINGQHEDTGRPIAIARSFVTTVPKAPEKMDFFADFSTNAGLEFKKVSEDTGLKQVILESDLYSLDFSSIEMKTYSIGSALGQLWVGYADWAADTNGKMRITPKKMAKLGAEKFLHVQAEFDFPSTNRRYPQLIISDRSPPVQPELVNGSTIIIQPFTPITDLQMQLCVKRTWDVNKQCPLFLMGRSLSFEPAYADGETLWPPRGVPGEKSGFDLPVALDVYVSTKKAYLFMDGKPFGCANLPADTFREGSVSVTLGDVLYHSGVDESVICDDCPHQFLKEYQLVQTVRRFDNFGFKAGVDEPEWNEVVLPCADDLEGG